MKKLWILLLLLLCPGIGEDEETPPPDDEETQDETEETQDETEETQDETEETQEETEEIVPRETRAQREIRNLRERAQKAEEQRAEAERQLAAARQGGQQGGQPQVTDEQRVFEQEEAVLRNPETTDWQRYAIQSNRSARAAEANSKAALRNAADIADRAKFDQLKAEKPKLYEKYAPQVETMLSEMRSKGSDAPRNELMALLIGRDMVAGKLTTEKKSAKPNGGAERGRTPGARSTVPSKGNGMTEAEKRAKRLEGIPI